MARSTNDGQPTAKPSRKVLVCTMATVLTPLVLRAADRWLFDGALLTEADITGITGLATLVAGYVTPPSDREGVA